MTTRILTLFGEELPPEPSGQGRGRRKSEKKSGKKGADTDNPDDTPSNESEELAQTPNQPDAVTAQQDPLPSELGEASSVAEPTGESTTAEQVELKTPPIEAEEPTSITLEAEVEVADPDVSDTSIEAIETPTEVETPNTSIEEPEVENEIATVADVAESTDLQDLNSEGITEVSEPAPDTNLASEEQEFFTEIEVSAITDYFSFDNQFENPVSTESESFENIEPVEATRNEEPFEFPIFPEDEPQLIEEEVIEPTHSVQRAVEPTPENELPQIEVQEILAEDITEKPDRESSLIDLSEVVPTPLSEPEMKTEVPASDEVPVPPRTKKGSKKELAKKTPEAEAGDQSDVPLVLAEWEPAKQYYTIGEVARLFRVNVSNIRFWTNEFKLKVRTTRKGDRLYAPEAIQELRMIYHLVKERGFTLSGAKLRIKENKKAEMKAVSLKQSLQSLRNQLLEIRNQLT